MTKHILLQKAYVYPLPKVEPEMTGCTFDNINGYWYVDSSKNPYINDDLMASGPRSKKCDVETGEDRKGE